MRGCKTNLLLLIFCISSLTVLAVGTALSQPTPSDVQSVYINAYNPYSLDIRLEVKCDWKGNIRRYALHQFFTVPGKSMVTIITPNYLKRCEIWPKIVF